MTWEEAEAFYAAHGSDCEKCPAYAECTLWEPVRECCIATIAGADEDDQGN